jgi:hypothetical protein
VSEFVDGLVGSPDDVDVNDRAPGRSRHDVDHSGQERFDRIADNDQRRSPDPLGLLGQVEERPDETGLIADKGYVPPEFAGTLKGHDVEVVRLERNDERPRRARAARLRRRPATDPRPRRFLKFRLRHPGCFPSAELSHPRVRELAATHRGAPSMPRMPGRRPMIRLAIESGAGLRTREPSGRCDRPRWQNGE